MARYLLCKTLLLIFNLTILASLSACDRRPIPIATKTAAASSIQSAAPQSNHLTDEWIGQWNGPEGTFMRIGGEQGEYVISIQNLDGLSQYQGRSVDNQIQFERNGVIESIRATKGEETGMKWLADKANCLTVHTGEGYCKD